MDFAFSSDQVLVIASLPVPSAEAGAGGPVSPGLEGGGFTPPPQSRPQGPQRLGTPRTFRAKPRARCSVSGSSVPGSLA